MPNSQEQLKESWNSACRSAQGFLDFVGQVRALKLQREAGEISLATLANFPEYQNQDITWWDNVLDKIGDIATDELLMAHVQTMRT